MLSIQPKSMVYVLTSQTNSIYTPQKSPTYKNDHSLRPWQLSGVSWLTFNWYNRRSCILADEMGLGKTVQTVATVESVRQAYCRGPFLVIVPVNRTC